MLRAVASRTLRATGWSGVISTCVPPGPRALVLAQPRVYVDPCSSSRNFRGAWGSRWFASAGSSTSNRHSVEGRYGHALLAAAQGAKALDQVHADVQGLLDAFQASSDFVAFAKTPGVTPETKVSVVQQIADRFKLHAVTKNFLCTVAENKRMADLPKMLSFFEELYREARGEIRCSVTSAQELTSGQKKEVVAALQKRAGPKATILAEFNVSPSIAGGLLVRMGDEVMDYTIATRLESLRTSLMAPLNA